MFFCFYEEDSGLSNEEKWENRPEENAKMIGYNFLIGKFRLALKFFLYYCTKYNRNESFYNHR